MFLDELVSPPVRPPVRLVLGLPGCRCVVVVVGGGGNLLIRLLLDGWREGGLRIGGVFSVVVVVVELERGDHLMFLLLSSFLPSPTSSVLRPRPRPRPDPDNSFAVDDPSNGIGVLRPVACYLVEPNDDDNDDGDGSFLPSSLSPSPSLSCERSVLYLSCGRRICCCCCCCCCDGGGGSKTTPNEKRSHDLKLGQRRHCGSSKKRRRGGEGRRRGRGGQEVRGGEGA